jgi:hypothetical protein
MPIFYCARQGKTPPLSHTSGHVTEMFSDVHKVTQLDVANDPRNSGMKMRYTLNRKCRTSPSLTS